MRDGRTRGDNHRRAARGKPARGKPATYKHQPLSRSLDEIRLLKLRKEEHGPVHCEVEVFSLEQAPEYIALSYRWGPPSPSHDIFIGDQGLKIRDILHACLLELREDVDTWLWIDQICIAQVDTTERNHQVGMMSRIYSNATSVIIWLSDVPLATPGEVDRFNDRDLDEKTGEEIMLNTYFKRLWIIQELLLAKKIKVCINGHRSVTWSTLQKRLQNCVGYDPASRLNKCRSAVYLLVYTKEDMPKRALPLLSCIQGFGNSECQEPRDLIFGLMGITAIEDRVTVDYEKSVLDVYLDAVNILMDKLPRPCGGNPTIHHLEMLGRGMRIDSSLRQGLMPLLKDLAHCNHDDSITPVRFEKAGSAQDPDCWRYERNGKRLSFACPPAMPRYPHPNHPYWHSQ